MEDLYREFEQWWAAQTRPLSSIDAAILFLEERGLTHIQPDDLANYNMNT